MSKEQTKMIKNLTVNDLTLGQKKAYDLVVDKKNIFLTGRSGSGKSFLIKYIKQNLESEYYRKVIVTSTTGISASLINGQTCNSYLGIGLGKKSYELLYDYLSKSTFYLQRWKQLEILVIDEVSMLNLELFEKLHQLACSLRKNYKPFGGIQLILSGDFLQLPAIADDNFLFESSIWDLIIQETVYLQEIIRQKDPIFIQVLNKIRMNEIDKQVRTVLESREILYPITDKTEDQQVIIPTMLFSTNNKVDRANEKYYDKLTGPEQVYKISYNWKKKVLYKEKYDSLIRFIPELKLKIGAQVMHLTNTGALFNGSRGVVTDFEGGYPIVLFSNNIKKLITRVSLDIEEKNDTILSYSQLPLKLAWSVSIHKAQGMSCDLLTIDCKKIFEYGQFYVALSRVRTLEGLFLKNLNLDLIKAHPRAIEFYKNLENE